MIPIPEFDAVYVISDLHLGGDVGFQIFNQGSLLKAWLEAIAQPDASRPRKGLVINGDTVDFLAEAGAKCFNPETAGDMLRQICDRTAFKPVFEGIHAFLADAHHRLIVNLGNHDIELALPWVAEVFLDVLSGGDLARRARVRLVSDGTGVRCRVHGREILCLQGNEVDPWNVTDYEKIRTSCADWVQGRDVEEWKPNAGSRMVVEVMNGIKRQHPFIDVLKPEGTVAVPVLLLIDPGQAGNIDELVGIARRMFWDRIKMRLGLLSEDTREHARAAPYPLLRAEAGDRIEENPPGAELGDRLLEEVDSQVRGDEDPLCFANRSPDAPTLGFGSYFKELVTGGSREDKIKAYLKGMEKDDSFRLNKEDEVYEKIDELAGPNFPFVVTGHTHMRRAMPRRKHGGWYLNTGTWVRLMNVTNGFYTPAKADQFLKEGIGAPSLDDAEAKGWVFAQPTAAVIRREDDGRITGGLYDISLNAAGDPVETKVAGSIIGA